MNKMVSATVAFSIYSAVCMIAIIVCMIFRIRPPDSIWWLFVAWAALGAFIYATVFNATEN